MSGRIVGPDGSPPRASRLDPLWKATNAGVFALNVPAIRTATIASDPPLTTIVGRSSTPTLFVAWHRFNYALTPVFLAFPDAARPTLVMHDGASSRALTHEASAWLGFETLVFRRRASTSPREQIAAYVRRTGRSLVNLPDSGGPYLRVKPGTIDLARACGMTVQPLVVDVDRAITVGRTLRHVVPLPFATIRARWGEPIRAEDVSMDAVQHGLDALAR